MYVGGYFCVFGLSYSVAGQWVLKNRARKTLKHSEKIGSEIRDEISKDPGNIRSTIVRDLLARGDDRLPSFFLHIDHHSSHNPLGSPLETDLRGQTMAET